MKPRKTLLCSLTLLAVVCGLTALPGPGTPAEAAMLMRVTAFTWDDGASLNSNWSDGDNWSGSDTYPSSTTDDATIPCNSGNKWTVDKDVDETIRKLEILEKVDFGGVKALTALELIFDSAGGAIEVTVTGNGANLIGNP